VSPSSGFLSAPGYAGIILRWEKLLHPKYQIDIPVHAPLE